MLKLCLAIKKNIYFDIKFIFLTPIYLNIFRKTRNKTMCLYMTLEVYSVAIFRFLRLVFLEPNSVGRDTGLSKKQKER